MSQVMQFILKTTYTAPRDFISAIKFDISSSTFTADFELEEEEGTEDGEAFAVFFKTLGGPC